jgi:hypothetical protein
VSSTCEFRGVTEAAERIRAIQAERPGKRPFVYFSVADVPLLLLLLCTSRGELASEFVSVCGGSAIGRGIARLLRSYGRRTVALRRAGYGVDLEDLRRVVRESSPVFITCEGSGAIGEVHPSLAKLIRSRRDLAVPLALCMSRGPSFRTGRLFAVSVALGVPVEPIGRDDREVLVNALGACREESRTLAVRK